MPILSRNNLDCSHPTMFAAAAPIALDMDCGGQVIGLDYRRGYFVLQGRKDF